MMKQTFWDICKSTGYAQPVNFIDFMLVLQLWTTYKHITSVGGGASVFSSKFLGVWELLVAKQTNRVADDYDV